MNLWGIFISWRYIGAPDPEKLKSRKGEVNSDQNIQNINPGLSELFGLCFFLFRRGV